MSNSFFNGFLAGFIRTHAIGRHVQRKTLLDAIKGLTITRIATKAKPVMAAVPCFRLELF